MGTVAKETVSVFLDQSYSRVTVMPLVTVSMVILSLAVNAVPTLTVYGSSP